MGWTFGPTERTTKVGTNPFSARPGVVAAAGGHVFIWNVAEDASDLAGHVDDEKNAVRVEFDNSQLRVLQILPDGREFVLPGSRVDLFQRQDETYSIINIRRPMVWDINKQSMNQSSSSRTPPPTSGVLENQLHEPRLGLQTWPLPKPFARKTTRISSMHR